MDMEQNEMQQAEEQRILGERLIAVGERLRCRADGVNRTVVDGEVVGDVSLALPVHTVEPNWEL
jgi:hypothetical protein